MITIKLSSMKKVTLSTYAVIITALLSTANTRAQDIRYSPLSATPATVNPAYTGSFNGSIRMSTIYESRWASVTVPEINYGSAFDLPIVTGKKGSYLAAGLQLIKRKAGDGDLTDFQGLASIAYHINIKTVNDSVHFHKSELSIGLQSGYEHHTLNLDKLYFGTPTVHPTGLGNAIIYYPLSTGISFAHASSTSFDYTIGIAAYNFVQSKNATEKQRNKDMGFNRQAVASTGANWAISKRLTFRPEVVYNTGSVNGNELIAGNEFDYKVNMHKPRAKGTTSIFAGAWYSSPDNSIITAGVTFQNFRVGIGYDYSYAPLNSSSNRNGGFQCSLRYISPTHKITGTKRNTPCARF
ncbi:MAG: hypothetical protein JWQ38_2190 [Flavipsychrobacter sp.]|nr:hypothetical protein [Flavipsychrobacter sp.]